MPWLILLLGIALFIYNFFSWQKIKNATLKKTARPEHWRFVRFLRQQVLEWRHYAFGNGSLKGMSGAIIASIIFLLVGIVNAWLAIFDPVILLPATVILLFFLQIRLGKRRRRRYFENHFPEALSVINSTVSAGSSIHQALARCGDTIAGDLGQVFHLIDRRLNLGEEPERVFKEAWQLYRYREFYFFSVVMIISMRHGSQLRELISRLSRIINSSKVLERRKKAMTSEARMSAKIVAAIPVLFFFGMKFFNPENFEFILNDPVGRLILYYVVISELIGMLIIWILLKRAL